MIVSASRRTDIPAFYPDWLLNRVRAGYVCTRNPFNAAQIRRVSLLPQDVDCIVLWTKDPLPLLAGLDELDRRGLPYYSQFTLTPYGRDLERNLRDKNDIAATFVALAARIGRERVRWRYDPVILNETWDIPRHRAAFARLCERLHRSTESVTVSFVDLYAKVRSNNIRALSNTEMEELAGELAAIARPYGLPVNACCETLDLSRLGIGKASCVDAALVARIAGQAVTTTRDTGQRPGCGCSKSVDIGAYNTCRNGCVYCYASHSAAAVERNCLRHDPAGAFLLG